MTSKKNLDPADRALAEEFGDYISEVAQKIVDPLKNVTESSLAAVSSETSATVAKVDASCRNHIDQFDKKTAYLLRALSKLKADMESAVNGIAEGHTQTRKELLSYAKQHSHAAREEMREQTNSLERSFLEAVEPRLEKLNEEVLLLFKRSVTDHQKAVEAKIAKLNIGLGLVAIEVLALALIFLALR